MRRWDWVERLNKVVEDANEQEFDFGSLNCALFAARCADAVREEEGAEDELRTHFTDEASALAWIEASGGIDALVSERLPNAVPWWKAQRGDLALIPTQLGPAVGVCMGERIAMLALSGLAFLPLDRAYKCWKVE